MGLVVPGILPVEWNLSSSASGRTLAARGRLRSRQEHDFLCHVIADRATTHLSTVQWRAVMTAGANRPGKLLARSATNTQKKRFSQPHRTVTKRAKSVD